MIEGDGVPVNAKTEDPKSDEGASAESKAAQADIQNALQSIQNVQAMRIHIVDEESDAGLKTELYLAHVKPDRFQMTSEGSDIIVIGDATFLAGPDGSWMESPADMTEVVKQALDAYISDKAIEQRFGMEQDWVDLRSLGKKVIHGVDVIGYESSQTTENIHSVMRMWLGMKDGLLYRQQIETDDSGKQHHSIVEFEYGPSVTIETPR